MRTWLSARAQEAAAMAKTALASKKALKRLPIRPPRGRPTLPLTVTQMAGQSCAGRSAASSGGERSAGHGQQAVGVHAGDAHHAGIGRDLLQHRNHGLEFGKLL